MTRKAFPGEFEQMVLLAILQLAEEAEGPAISRHLEAKAGRRISRGALYATLDRLERKGMVEWQIDSATARRAGNRRRRFSVTAAGIRALSQSRNALLNLWQGVEHLLES